MALSESYLVRSAPASSALTPELAFYATIEVGEPPEPMTPLVQQSGQAEEEHAESEHPIIEDVCCSRVQRLTSSSSALGASIQSDGYVCEELARELAPLGTPGVEPPPPSQFMTLVEGIGPTSREMWAQLGEDVMMQLAAALSANSSESI